MSGKKKKAESEPPPEIAPQREILKAIILADSFDQKFQPITLESPRALLPVVNIPLLNYTIEFLASNGVEEILVFCCAHAKKIQDYLSSSKWTSMPGVVVKTIVSLNALSAGDALREIESQQLIKADFILVSGDVVSNMNLQEVLQLHKERRKKDKSCIMTMVMKRATPIHRTRSMQDDVVVAVDKMSGQLLYWESDVEAKQLEIGLDVFNTHSQVQLRNDLIDCRIDICSPEVLLLFADNFDYQDPRNDFLKGVLSDEVISYKIFTHVISREYAARVKCLRTYDSVSKDITHRWAYPLVPDNNMFSNTTYTVARDLNYREKNVKLSKTTKLQETVIGEGTEVGDNTKIFNSIIGRGCTIGANVKIIGSYIWDGVTIEDNSVVLKSIVCNDVKILKNTHVEPGCLISFDVSLGPDFTLPRLHKITTYTPSDDDLTEGEAIKQIDLGDKGFGSAWIDREVDNTNSIIGHELLTKTPKADSDVETESESETEKETNKKTDEERFLKEAYDIVHSSIVENHPVDNVVLELNSLKYAYNTGFIDCAAVILKTFLDEVKAAQEATLLTAFQKVMSKWSKLLAKFVQSDDDQVEVIWALQDYCEKDGKEKFKAVFPLILHQLYDAEIVAEDSIWKWVEEQKGAPDQTFITLSEKFLTWLKEAEEDEEGDEEEEEESEEEKSQPKAPNNDDNDLDNIDEDDHDLDNLDEDD